MRLYQLSQLSRDKSVTAHAQLGRWRAAHGPEFNLGWRGNVFPVKLYKYRGEWRLIYREKKQYTHYVPFALECSPHNPTEIHIHNIHKTGKHAGSTLVNFVLAVCRKLGALSATLQDAAEVTCAKNGQDVALSVIQLLKHGKSFYERFGFQPDSAREHKKALALVNRVRKIKLHTVHMQFERAIHILVNANKDPKTFELVEKQHHGYPAIYIRNPKSKIPDMLSMYRHIARKMKASKCTYFAEFLVQIATHKADCAVYTDLLGMAFTEHVLRYRGTELDVNKWANLVQRIDYEYPKLMKYTF